MSNLFGMINTGLTGLNASQVGLSVTGNNVANMKNPNYSRQAVDLASNSPYSTSSGYIGTGVKVAGVNRVYDEALARSVRNESSSYSYYNSMSSNLKEAMLYFNELEDGSGLGDSLKNYFNAWQELGNTAPDNTSESSIKRQNLLEKAVTLSSKVREGYGSMVEIQNKADTVIKESVASINSISKDIAELNGKIKYAEAGGNKANDMRDARDTLLDKLSSLVNISTYRRSSGEIAVYIGGQTLVDGGTAHKLVTVKNHKNGDHLDIAWQADSLKTATIDMTPLISGGKIGAALKTRDELLKGYMKNLDSLAGTIISSTNRIHSSGQGLERFAAVSGSIGSANPRFKMSSPEGKLNFPVKSGSFKIRIYDDNGKIANSYTINVNKDDSFQSVIDKIAGADGSEDGGIIDASLDKDGSMHINAGSGYTLAFADDTSDFLMATGVNAFFKGSSAKDMDVSDLVSSNISYIAANKTGAPGDNTNAKEISKLQFQKIAGDSSITVEGFYGYFIGEMGTDKSQIDSFAATKKMAYNQLNTQLTSLKGVSEQEETINLATYQRMFELNSRYINVVDQMLNTIINGLGVGGR